MANGEQERKGAWLTSLGCMSVPGILFGVPSWVRAIQDPELTLIWWAFFAGNILLIAVLALIMRRRWWIAAMVFPVSTIVLSGFQGLILAGSLVWVCGIAWMAWLAWPRKAKG